MWKLQTKSKLIAWFSVIFVLYFSVFSLLILNSYSSKFGTRWFVVARGELVFLSCFHSIIPRSIRYCWCYGLFELVDFWMRRFLNPGHVWTFALFSLSFSLFCHSLPDSQLKQIFYYFGQILFYLQCKQCVCVSIRLGCLIYTYSNDLQICSCFLFRSPESHFPHNLEQICRGWYTCMLLGIPCEVCNDYSHFYWLANMITSHNNHSPSRSKLNDFSKSQAQTRKRKAQMRKGHIYNL